MTMVTKMPKAAKMKCVRDSIIKMHMEVVRDFETRNKIRKEKK